MYQVQQGTKGASKDATKPTIGMPIYRIRYKLGPPLNKTQRLKCVFSLHIKTQLKLNENSVFRCNLRHVNKNAC